MESVNDETNCLNCEFGEHSKGIVACLADRSEKFDPNPLFIPELSSSDPYNTIDLSNNNDKGFYTSSLYDQKKIENGKVVVEEGSNIKYELQEPVLIDRIKIYAGATNFPKRLSYQLNNNLPIVFEPEFENEPDHVKTLNFEPQMVHTLTINTKNPNDEEDTWPIIRKIEMFQPNKDVGVFTQLIQNSEHHDPHRIGVFISATCFDTNHFFRIQPDEVYKYHVITHNEENSWFQVKLIKGCAQLTGFRLQKIDWNNTLKYKIIASFDGSTWITLYQTNDEEKELFVVKKFDKISPKIKIIKIIQIGKSGNNCFQFKFYHFDVFGKYFSD